MVTQHFLLSLKRFLEHTHRDSVLFEHGRVIVSVVLITWLGEIVVQAKDNVFMILLDFAIGGIVEVFDLSKLNRRKFVSANLVSLEELLSFPDIECDVIR